MILTSHYRPEDGINLKMIDRDIDYMREVFAKDRGQSRAGKIILRNEKASDVYTTQLLADMIKVEAKGRFEARAGIPVSHLFPFSSSTILTN